jgi:hypothetical protein
VRKFKVQTLRHQTAGGQGGRDLARKLSRKQGRRPRVFSTGEIRGEGRGVEREALHENNHCKETHKVKHFDA